MDSPSITMVADFAVGLVVDHPRRFDQRDGERSAQLRKSVLNRVHAVDARGRGGSSDRTWLERSLVGDQIDGSDRRALDQARRRHRQQSLRLARRNSSGLEIGDGDQHRYNASACTSQRSRCRSAPTVDRSS